MLAIFALKLRMAGRVFAYIDFSKTHTILYGGAYIFTQAALLIIIIYYIAILKNLPLYPRASVLLPLSAIVLLLSSLVLETILFFVYSIGLEPSPLRTAVIRPIFYFGFIGLSAYFLFPALKKANNRSILIEDDSSPRDII